MNNNDVWHYILSAAVSRSRKLQLCIETSFILLIVSENNVFFLKFLTGCHFNGVQAELLANLSLVVGLVGHQNVIQRT